MDVNAQQHFMSGLVLLNQEPKDGNEHKSCNLVIVEGGPKGIRKFVKLMTQRYGRKYHAVPNKLLCYTMLCYDMM